MPGGQPERAALTGGSQRELTINRLSGKLGVHQGGFELSGQPGSVIDARDSYFDQQMQIMADLIGL